MELKSSRILTLLRNRPSLLPIISAHRILHFLASKLYNSSADDDLNAYSLVIPKATLLPFRRNSQFLAVYTQIKKHTLVDIYRCAELWNMAKRMESVDGDVLEVGVWRGGSGALLAHALLTNKNKRIFLADTFEGVVKAGKFDPIYTGGEHSNTSEKVVNDLVSKLKLSNVTILKGVFPDDTSTAIQGKICLLHCDVDVYESAKQIVEWCMPKLTIGGVVIFDDYGFPSCSGITSYCHELQSDPRFIFIHNLNGHAIFVKVLE